MKVWMKLFFLIVSRIFYFIQIFLPYFPSPSCSPHQQHLWQRCNHTKGFEGHCHYAKVYSQKFDGRFWLCMPQKLHKCIFQSHSCYPSLLTSPLKGRYIIYIIYIIYMMYMIYHIYHTHHIYHIYNI